MENRKLYLGDSVYAEMMSYGDIILTTENGYGPTNMIVLEPRVFDELVLFSAFHERAAESGVV
jgi:hypothetical protein